MGIRDSVTVNALDRLEHLRESGPVTETQGAERVEEMVRSVCGPLLDELVFTMRDHLAQPITLPPVGPCLLYTSRCV